MELNYTANANNEFELNDLPKSEGDTGNVNVPLKLFNTKDIFTFDKTILERVYSNRKNFSDAAGLPSENGR